MIPEELQKAVEFLVNGQSWINFKANRASKSRAVFSELIVLSAGGRPMKEIATEPQEVSAFTIS